MALPVWRRRSVPESVPQPVADIGTLAAAEIPAAAVLWEAAGLIRPWNDPVADAVRALAGPASTIFAARRDGVLVGTVMTGHDGHRGWVYYLAVTAAAQRGGIARKLLAAAETWCAAAGVPRLNLMVRAGNTGVMGFYDRLGYRASDVVVLQKDLPVG
jgi:ribosomal protein S18 acetylase RimI-like enzyme